MNWFNRVRNSLGIGPKRTTEKDLWAKCPACMEMLFAKSYATNLQVCPRCAHHGRIGADERLAMLPDEGFELIPQHEEIGSASVRERVCQSVSITVEPVPVKIKKDI